MKDYSQFTNEDMSNIREDIKNIILSYGEQYGSICYHVGQDKTRSLPIDSFIDICVDKVMEKLKSK